MFDANDVDYLVKTLSERQLWQELSGKRVQRALERHRRFGAVGLDADGAYWADYGKALELALAIIASRRSPAAASGSPGPGRVASGDISALKADILSVVGRYVALKPGGSGRYVGRCCFHDDKHASLTIYLKDSRFYCYGCHKSGDAIDFVMLAEGVGFREAVSSLGVRVGR